MPKFWFNNQVYVEKIDKSINKYTTNIMLEPKSQYRYVGMPSKDKPHYTEPDNKERLQEEKQDKMDLIEELKIQTEMRQQENKAKQKNK